MHTHTCRHMPCQTGCASYVRSSAEINTISEERNTAASPSHHAARGLNGSSREYNNSTRTLTIFHPGRGQTPAAGDILKNETCPVHHLITVGLRPLCREAAALGQHSHVECCHDVTAERDEGAIGSSIQALGSIFLCLRLYSGRLAGAFIQSDLQ